MKRVLVLVEGPTEDRFVKDVLRPHLEERGVTAIPTIVATKRVKSGPDFKGGVQTFGKVEADLRRLLRDSDAVRITTMLDFYGFPKDFAGWSAVKSTLPAQRVTELQDEIEKHIYEPRFRAYLMLHEYEAMLFSDPEVIASSLNDSQSLSKLAAVRAAFSGPEEIDDGPETAPSKRLTRILPGYRKRLHGPLIVGRIGLDKVRAVCPHLDQWLSDLEALGTGVTTPGR